MLDTVMALWNHGYQYKGIRIFFSISFICISISLLLITIVIPGYILFTQSTTDLVATDLQNSAITSVQDGGSSFISTQKPMVTSTPALVKKRCVLPRKAQPGGHALNPQAPFVQQIVPPSVLLPTATVPTSEHILGTKLLVASHHLYAGEPNSSVSHLHRSGQGLSQKNPSPALVPQLSPTPGGKIGIHPRIALINLQPDESVSRITAIQTNTLSQQLIVDSCPS